MSDWQPTRIGGAVKNLPHSTVLLVVPPGQGRGREWAAIVSKPYHAPVKTFHRTKEAAMLYASGVAGDMQGILTLF